MKHSSNRKLNLNSRGIHTLDNLVRYFKIIPIIFLRYIFGHQTSRIYTYISF